MSHRVRSRPVLVCATLAVITLALTSTFAWSQKATEDLPAGAMQAKATTSCLECHEARIILQQRLSKAAWTKEVDKMMKVRIEKRCDVGSSDGSIRNPPGVGSDLDHSLMREHPARTIAHEIGRAHV